MTTPPTPDQLEAARKWLMRLFPYGSPFAQSDLAEKLATLIAEATVAERRRCAGIARTGANTARACSESEQYVGYSDSSYMWERVAGTCDDIAQAIEADAEVVGGK